MYSQPGVRRYSLSAIPFLFCLVVCTVTVIASLQRSKAQEILPEDLLRKRIELLMIDTLREREKSTPDGLSLWVRVPINKVALQEMKGYGDKATLILAEYLKTGAYQERELALEFLGHLGGTQVIERLQMVIRHDPEPSLRESALTYVSRLSWEAVSSILREASKTDPNSRVREYAEYLLGSHEARDLRFPSGDVIRKRIAALMSYILKKGEGITSDGVKFQTVARPSNEDIEEIKRYGDDAIPVLSEYLVSEDGREKNLAMRFLGILGGKRIVEPLEKVILKDPWPGAREMALRWLTEAPWDLASPIIQRAAQNDPDPDVRQVAGELLNTKKRR